VVSAVAPSDGGASAPPITTPESAGPWTVQLTVVRCINLPKMDVLGKVDGFVRIIAGPFRTDTKVVKKEYNPVFEHQMPPVELLTYSGFIRLEVYDWDSVGSNDLIAVVQLPMFEIARLCGPALAGSNSIAVEQNVVFENCKHQNSTIVLRFAVTWPVALHPCPPPIKQQFLAEVESKKILHVLTTWKVRGWRACA
jgi:hypothetical protein